MLKNTKLVLFRLKWLSAAKLKTRSEASRQTQNLRYFNNKFFKKFAKIKGLKFRMMLQKNEIKAKVRQSLSDVVSSVVCGA